jgi:ribosomal protein RSM22 (predicted rRNA methylase)
VRHVIITNYNPQRMKIPSEWQETFDRKMSDEEFSRKVNVLREAKERYCRLKRIRDKEDVKGVVVV